MNVNERTGLPVPVTYRQPAECVYDPDEYGEPLLPCHSCGQNRSQHRWELLERADEPGFIYRARI